jgi:hypothetical protein
VVGRRAVDGASEQNPWMEIVGVVPVFSNTFTAPGYFGRPGSMWRRISSRISASTCFERQSVRHLHRMRFENLPNNVRCSGPSPDYDRRGRKRSPKL